MMAIFFAVNLIQATEVIREADKASDKYGLTTVLLIAFCLLLLLAVWRVILPLFKDAQAKHEAAMKAQVDLQKELTKDFLISLKEVRDSHKEEVETILGSLNRERQRGNRQ